MVVWNFVYAKVVMEWHEEKNKNGEENKKNKGQGAVARLDKEKEKYNSRGFKSKKVKKRIT